MLNTIRWIAILNKWILYKIQDATTSHKYNIFNFIVLNIPIIVNSTCCAINSIKNVDVLYLEVNERELYKKCGLINEIDTFLSQYNFKRVLTEMTQFGWGDAIYIKN